MGENLCPVIQNGRYQITLNDVDVYLSVWSPANGGLQVSKFAIIQELVDKKINNFDSDFIATVIREAIGKPILIASILPPVDGKYQIIATDVGVYISVWPSSNGGTPVSTGAIIEELTNQNFINFDSDFLSTVIKEALGIPTLIVNSLPSIQLKQNVCVKVQSDCLEARIDISLSEAAPLLTMSQLLDEIKAAGVVYGIDEQVLEALTQMRSATNVVCASATLPTVGDDACLKYHIDPDSQGRPVEMEDGRVDFKEINHFLCVEEGQLLVEKKPATWGSPGVDVLGAAIPPKRGRDVSMPVGKNVIVVDDWRLYAAIHGHLNIFLDKRINVIPVIVIEGDVDLSTGNIDFKGGVIVRGSVQSGFSVKAGGNVEVYGNICSGIVEAQSLIVHNGIQGVKHSVIKVRERLVANFIDNAIVYADEDIVVSDFILNSSVFAGMRVIVEGGRGLVRGGRVSAGEVIRACTIGNQTGVTTQLEVSVNPFLKDERLNLRQELKKAEIKYKELQQSLSYFCSQGVERLSAEKLERYKKYEAEYNELSERLADMQQHIANIEAILYSLKPGRVRASSVIYPGTKVYIGSLKKVFNTPLEFSSLYVLGDAIKITALR